MISTSLKIETARRALAEGWIKSSAEALRRMSLNELPKPDVLHGQGRRTPGRQENP